MDNQKTFTDKIISVLLGGDMPSAKGKDAKETGLIIVMKEGTTPVCASYGSSRDIICSLFAILQQNEPIREAITTAFALFAEKNPNSAEVQLLKNILC